MADNNGSFLEILFNEGKGLYSRNRKVFWITLVGLFIVSFFCFWLFIFKEPIGEVLKSWFMKEKKKNIVVPVDTTVVPKPPKKDTTATIYEPPIHKDTTPVVTPKIIAAKTHKIWEEYQDILVTSEKLLQKHANQTPTNQQGIAYNQKMVGHLETILSNAHNSNEEVIKHIRKQIALGNRLIRFYRDMEKAKAKGSLSKAEENVLKEEGIDIAEKLESLTKYEEPVLIKNLKDEYGVVFQIRHKETGFM